MKLVAIIKLVLLMTFLMSCSPKEMFREQSIALINNVSFKDASFDNPNASNGFLVKHKNKIYGITAKHILMISKTDKMSFVDFEGELKQWKMHPKNDPSNYVVMDQLLNTNRKDSLTWDYMYSHWEAYDDWLIFSVKEQAINHKVLKFSNTALEKGTPLYAIGWTYTDSLGAQRVYEYRYDSTEGNFHKLLQVKGPKKLGGLSGAPIVDEKGALVGLVSSGGESEKANEIILEATSIKNMLKFIVALN